ncbi:MAG: transglutaminase family protein [Parvibaculaceae bacterium]
MRIHIEHETTYSYDETVSYSIQALRLRPLDTRSQRIVNWSVETPQNGSVREQRDVYGNVLQMLYVERPHTEIKIRVSGDVETSELNGVVASPVERFPPRFYLRKTLLTEADEQLKALAGAARAASDGTPLDLAHHLMHKARDQLDYMIGETDATTTAAQALANGSGVCQDHAHVFIAAARELGIPARYVSGYLWTEAGEQGDAAHAWAEAYIDDLGWVGFDVANRICPTEAHLRVASGLDYLEAAPIRGLRRGGGQETLDVRVHVAESGTQQ